MPESFPLRPRDLRDLLDDSFHLYKVHFLKLLAPSVVVCFALQALGGAFAVRSAAPPAPSRGAEQMRDGMTMLGILGLAALAYFVSLGWTASILHRELIPATLRDRTRPASFLRRSVGYLFTFLLVVALYLFGLVFFSALVGYVGMAVIGLSPGYGMAVYPWVCVGMFVPLVLGYGTLLALALPAAVIEGRAGFSALKRGIQIFFADVRKAVLSRLLLLALLCAGLGILIGGTQMTDRHPDPDPDPTLSPAGMGAMFATFAVGQAVLLPVYLNSLILLYYDVRIRREGWDLEQAVRELESRAGAGPHPGGVETASPQEVGTPGTIRAEG